MLNGLLVWCAAYYAGALAEHLSEVRSDWFAFIHLIHIFIFVGVVGALIYRAGGG